MSNTIKVAVLPGKVQEFVLEAGATFNDAFALAEVQADGFEVKADGRTVTDYNEQVGGTSMILLAKRVKGNAPTTVKVAMLPGKVVEIALDDSASFYEALEEAELDADGYEVKADGRTVSNFDEQIGNTSMILLAKKVKGNVKGK